MDVEVNASNVGPHEAGGWTGQPQGDDRRTRAHRRRGRTAEGRIQTSPEFSGLNHCHHAKTSLEGMAIMATPCRGSALNEGAIRVCASRIHLSATTRGDGAGTCVMQAPRQGTCTTHAPSYPIARGITSTETRDHRAFGGGGGLGGGCPKFGLGGRPPSLGVLRAELIRVSGFFASVLAGKIAGSPAVQRFDWRATSGKGHYFSPEGGWRFGRSGPIALGASSARRQVARLPSRKGAA